MATSKSLKFFNFFIINKHGGLMYTKVTIRYNA